jgi:tetratricopeptide (TPR) repeat protein
LTPLDPLALTPRTDWLAIVAGVGGIIVVSALAWRARKTMPLPAGAWAAYLLLLVPAMGLVPSGLQSTADRYTYMPAVALSVAVVVLVGRGGQAGRVGGQTGLVGRVGLVDQAGRANRAKQDRAQVGRLERASAAVAVAVVTMLAALTWRQVHYWRDSRTLWTRAVEIDAGNDIALYNLGAALAEEGRRDEAIARYDQALAIVPTNGAARRNRDLLLAARLEDEANRLAVNRDLAGAVARYTEALKLDPKRTHSQAALGMALVEMGRPEQGRPHLQAALDQGIADPAIPNALAFVLAQSGDEAAAIAVLRAARERFPGDANIARNLDAMTRR